MQSSVLGHCSLLLLSVVFFSFGFANAQPVARAELQGEFYERMNPDVEVSGSVVVGVSSDGVFDGDALEALAVYPVWNSDSDSRKICLTVESHDGFYLSRNEFGLPEAYVAGTPLLLPYDLSRFKAQLAEYKDRTLALKAVPYACKAVGDARLVLPVTQVGHSNAKTLRFYVNAMNATDVFISSGQAEGLCHPVPGRHTNFDHICEIALPVAAETPLESGVVRIERERYGRELPIVEIQVMQGAVRP